MERKIESLRWYLRAWSRWSRGLWPRWLWYRGAVPYFDAILGAPADTSLDEDEGEKLERWQLHAINQAVDSLPRGLNGAIRAYYLRERALGTPAKDVLEAAEKALVPLVERRNLILQNT